MHDSILISFLYLCIATIAGLLREVGGEGRVTPFPVISNVDPGKHADIDIALTHTAEKQGRIVMTHQIKRVALLQ